MPDKKTPEVTTESCSRTRTKNRSKVEVISGSHVTKSRTVNASRSQPSSADIAEGKGTKSLSVTKKKVLAEKTDSGNSAN